MGRRKPNKQTHPAGEAELQWRRRGPQRPQKGAPGPARPSSPGAEPTGARHPPTAHAAPASVLKTEGRPAAADCGITLESRCVRGNPQAETPRHLRRTSREPTLPRVPTVPPALTAGAAGPPITQSLRLPPARPRPLRPRRPHAHLALRG